MPPQDYPGTGSDPEMVIAALESPSRVWPLLAAVYLKLVRAHLGIPPRSTWNRRNGLPKTYAHDYIERVTRVYLGRVAMSSAPAPGSGSELAPQVAAGVLEGLDKQSVLSGLELPACLDVSRVIDDQFVVGGAQRLLADVTLGGSESYGRWVRVVADLAYDTASALTDPHRRWGDMNDELAAAQSPNPKVIRRGQDGLKEHDRHVEFWEVVTEYLHQRLKPKQLPRLEEELSGPPSESSEPGAPRKAKDYDYARVHYIPRMYRMQDFSRWMLGGGERLGDEAAAEMAQQLTGRAAGLVTRPGEACPGVAAPAAGFAAGPM